MAGKQVDVKTELASELVDGEQIAAWKRVHGEVYELEVGIYRCWLRRPDREVMRFMLSTDDAIGRAECLLRDCWLGGDVEVQTDDACVYAAIPVLAELIPAAVARLKKT